MPVQETSEPLRGQTFRGVNLQMPPERLPASDFQMADNMWIIGGELWTRPGKHAMFTVALPNPIYALTAYAVASASDSTIITTWLMFVSGGKLYVAQAGATSAPTEVKIGGTGGTSFALNSARVRMERIGQWMYIIDAVGALYQVNIPYINPLTAYIAQAYVGLNAPTSTFTCALTNQVIDSTSDATKWSSVPALSWPGSGATSGTGTVGPTTAETISNTANSLFTGGTSSPSPYPTGWTDGGDTPGYISRGALPGIEIYLDAGASPTWHDYSYPAPTYPAGTNTVSSARVFVIGASGHAWFSDGASFSLQLFPESAAQSSQTVTSYTDLLIASSGVSSTISSAAHPFQTTDANKVITIFSGTDVTAPGNYTITAVNGGTHVATINGNPGSAGGHANGLATLSLDSAGAAGDHNSTLQTPPSAITGADQVYMTPPNSGNIIPYSTVISFSTLGTDIDAVMLRITGAANTKASGISIPSLKVVDVRIVVESSPGSRLHLRANNPVGLGFNCLGGVWIKRDYTSDPGGFRDFSQSNTISMKYSAPTTTGQIPFRFGFLQSGTAMGTDGANIVWSNPVTYTADGSAFYCDCSTIDPTVRAQTAYLFIQVMNDLAATINPADLCTIGPISTSGNLTLHELYGGIGGDYSYQFTKINASADSVAFIDVIESDPSPMSTPPAQPNGVSNQARFLLPSDPGDGTTHWGIYRFGGVFDDGLGRLIARVAIASDQAQDATHTYAWNHTTLAFVDNTPDSALEINIPTFLLTGRTPLPVGATCIAQIKDRIVAAIGSKLFISWTIIGKSGLYFNQINVADPNDIAQSIKGAMFDTGGADNDPIQALVPFGAYVIIMKQRGRLLLTGTDAASFDIGGDTLPPSNGLAASLGWAIFGRKIAYLAGDGAYAFDGSNDDEPMSLDIEPTLNPENRNGTALNSTAYGASFMVWHGQRLYLCAPATAADTSPSMLWIWDSRVHGGDGGWVSWGQLDRNMQFTCAASLTQSGTVKGLYFAGRDGQIYNFTGNGDMAAATSAPQPIRSSFMSRAEGQQTVSTFGAEIIGPEYFNEQTPTWVQLNVVTQENTAVTVGVHAAGQATVWTHNYSIPSKQLCVRKEVDAAVKGVNCWVTVTASTITPIVIKRVALELSAGAPGVN